MSKSSFLSEQIEKAITNPDYWGVFIKYNLLSVDGVQSILLCNCVDDLCEQNCRTVTFLNTGEVLSNTCENVAACSVRKEMSKVSAGSIKGAVLEEKHPSAEAVGEDQHSGAHCRLTLRAYRSVAPYPSTFFVTANIADTDEATVGSVRDVFIQNAECIEKCLLVNALAGYGFVSSKSVFNLVERSINPLLVLDREGQVKHMNQPAKKLLTGEYGLGVSNAGKVTGLTASMKETLGNLLKAVFADEQPVACRPVRNEVDDRCDLVLLYRLSSERNPQNVWAWFFERECLALMVIRRVTAKQELCVELIGDAFNLTPKEARLTAALTGGFTLDEYAEKEGVSKETVRWHLRQIMQKTNTRSQTDLVRLVLYGMSFPGVF